MSVEQVTNYPVHYTPETPVRHDRSNDQDVCELYCFNEALVRRLQQSLPSDGEIEQAAALFSIIGSRTRLLVLYCLSEADELCVCDIANALQMNLSTISHQLRVLRSAGLVRFRTEGKMSFYRLSCQETGKLIRSKLAPAVSAL